MSFLEDPILKSKYQKSKYRVKVWESEFMDKFGRKPNKSDIKQADWKIKQAYKLYWDLKTRALEDSLIDVAFPEDSLNSSDTVLKESSNKSTSVEVSEKTFNDSVDDSILHSTCLSNILNDSANESLSNPVNNSSCAKTEIENDPDICNGMQNVRGVWSRSLNMKKNDRSKHLLVGRSSFQLSQKMFENSTFIKRNPRKSLSKSKSMAKTKTNEECKIIKKDTTENEISKDTTGSEIKESATEIKNNLFNVNTTTNKDGINNVLDECDKGKDISDDDDDDLSSLLDCNVKFKIVDNKKSYQPILSGVQQIIMNRTTVRSLDPGWIERCMRDVQHIKHSFEPSSLGNENNTDEDDFVYNSDSEGERRRKRRRDFQKLYSEEDVRKLKRMCLEDLSDSQNEPSPLFTTNGLSSNSSTTSAVQSKNVEDDVSGPTVVNNKPVKRKGSPEEGHVVRKRMKNVCRNEANSANESDEIEDIVKAKRKVRKKVNTKGKITQKSKATATRKSTRMRKAKATFSELEDEHNSEPHVAIENYDIDNINAAARFALMPASTGSLVQDFSLILGVNSTEDLNESCQTSSDTPITKSSDRLKLEKKIANGTLNDNFVRINLKKKVYVRGKKNFNYVKYKKNLWKQRRKELETSEANMAALDYAGKKGNEANFCFNCNESGHFSRYCPKNNRDTLLPFEESENIEIPSEFPTLEEAAQMARVSSEVKFSKMAPRLNTDGKDLEDDLEELEVWEDDDAQEYQLVKEVCKVPEELIEKLLPPEKNSVPPLYSLTANNSIIDTPPEVLETLKQFGYDSFRPGQEKAIMRILSGVSTLVTLATGTGKSLCYQLPAFMFARRFDCITIVVSPLVSLMDDQVKGICPILNAACLHTNQTEKVRQEVITSVKKRKVDVLLVSPEAIVAGEKSSGFGAIIRDLPPIAFACIDEVHCISQWSHNFRPSYLMLCRVLREKLKVKVILGLTATATKSNAMSIIEHLGIPDGLEGVVTDRPLPDNLQLTVSRDGNRDEALIKLLNSSRLKDCKSILIYCTRREECVRIAAMLRTVFQDIKQMGESKKKRISPVAEAYHAGFSAYQRKRVQKAFMSGETKIIVATVAFGMGINKSDIRCVIHYNMPSNFENYVQEIGRAGRDGLPAQCHLFLNSKEEQDKMELRRHIYSNSVERRTIRELLHRLFVPCSCLTPIQMSSGQRCAGHEIALPINDVVAALDTSEEIISTLLCYLELHPKRYITVLSTAYVMARVSTYGGCRALKLAAQHSPPLAMAIALGLKNGTYTEQDAMIDFNVIEIASNIGWDSGIVKSHLKGLEWITVNGVTKRSQISVKYHTLGLRIRASGDLTEAELDEALDALTYRCKSQESSRILQLNSICEIVRRYSVINIEECSEMIDQIIDKSDNFKKEIRKYFVEDDPPLEKLHSPTPQNVATIKEKQIIQDVRSLLNIYRDTKFTGRAVARIFYGIQSPNYPARIWSRCKFWRAHLDVDFNKLCQLATPEIFAMR